MRNTTVRSIAHEVNTGARSAERVARETLERAAAYDSIQPEAWISRLPAEQVLERARWRICSAGRRLIQASG